jgi:hypothetical protein
MSRMKLATIACIAAVSLCASEPGIVISTPMAPPAWALLERELLRANSRAAEAFAEKYVDDKGYLLHYPRWGTLDGTDDAIETFHNWTLLHALGGSDSVLRLFRKALEGHYEQYKNVKTVTTEIAKDGAYYKEFLPMSDWFHNGEGMRGLTFLGLSDPGDRKFNERMRRFAGLYMNEDPEAQNYDPKVKIIRSIWNGSKGPMLRKATKEDWVGDPASGWFHFLHGAGGMSRMEDFAKAYPEMLAHCAEYLNSVGDHPLNLAATNLALNAYSLTHEAKYKNWLLEYVDAWKQRIEANGGNIPTNIGLDGTIGGEFGGKWYGGTYGWSFTIWSPEFKTMAHRNTFDAGMWPGFGNALLVSGDQKYVGTLRKQMDNLYAQARTTNGQLTIPQMYGDKGWYHWTRGLFHNRLTEIYMWSMDRRDLERIPKRDWIGYLEGEETDYPEKALRRDLERIRRQMERVRNDPTTPDTRLADYPMVMNPVSTEALVNLTTGGYLTGNIWTMHCRARYFDPVARRSGLPPDVAALVEKLSGTETVLTLVNTNQTDPRIVAVQAGGYAEHRWTGVTLDGKSTPLDTAVLTVRLAPGAGARLTLGTRRYANEPTFAQPWDRGWMVKAPR